MRLIDADKLERLIKSKPWGIRDFDIIDEILRIINQTPTIDTVKHGRWIGMNSYYANKYETLFFYRCSECQQEVDEYGVDNYCSHCGAKMDGENK